MPYNPQVTDISGQILAQGIMNRGQAYGGAISGVAQNIQDFMKSEAERQKTTGAIQGFLNDPYFQQQVANNPTLSASAQKIQSGNARLADVQQFLGSLTAMQHSREMDMKQQQMDMDKQYKDALREQAIASAAATEAATKERERIQNQAVERAGLLKTIFAMNAPATEEGEEPKTADISANTLMRQALAAGMMPDADTIRMFDKMSEYETAQSKLAQQAAESERRAAAAESRGLAADVKAAAATTAAERRNVPPELQGLLDLREKKLITEEEFQRRLPIMLDKLQAYKPDPMTALANILGGGLGTGDGTIPKPTAANAAGAAARSPATTRFTIQLAK